MSLFSVFPIKTPGTQLCCTIQEERYVITTQLPRRVVLYLAFTCPRKVDFLRNNRFHSSVSALMKDGDNAALLQ